MNTVIWWTALHRRVLAVYVRGYGSDWAAYIVPVEGRDHAAEAEDWRRDGEKLPQAVARAINPGLCAELDRSGLVWRD